MASSRMPRTDSTQAMKTIIGAYADDDDDASSDDDSTMDIPAVLTTSHGEDASANISESEDDGAMESEKRHSSEEYAEEASAKKARHEPRTATRLVSYGPDDVDDDDDKDANESHDLLPEFPSSSEVLPNSGTNDPQTEESKALSGYDVQIPAEPAGKCANKLQEKIARCYEKMMHGGRNMNTSIQNRKDFRNPSIYEKLITFCGIDEKGTNYPLSLYNPTIFGAESMYDELAKVQKIEMDKREKERRDKTKIEFVTGTKKSTADSSSDAKRKSKWDTQPAASSGTAAVPSSNSQSTAVKSTVIPAVGALKKPK